MFKNILLGLMLAGSICCATTTKPPVRSLREGLTQDSLAKVHDFQNELLKQTKADAEKGVKIELELKEYSFQDDFNLALVHFVLTIEENKKATKGHIFFLLGRGNTDSPWIPMNNFVRLD